jgi:hypothetical protein
MTGSRSAFPADKTAYKIAVTLLAAAALIFVTNTFAGRPSTHSLQPSDDLRVFNVVDITPLYNGRSSSWDEVNAAVAQGRAGIQLVYNDDVVSLVAVFDTQTQRDAWVCSPAAPVLLRDRPCLGSSQETHHTSTERPKL